MLQAGLDAEGRRNAAEAEEGGEGSWIHSRSCSTGKGAQGRQLGAKGQHRLVGAGKPAPVEGFFCKAIGGELQPPLAPVPEGQGEHADAALQGGGQPPGLDGGQQGFGVGMAAPWLLEEACGVQLAAQGLAVVDLAVEGDHVAPRGAGHGLVAGEGEIEDRQPPAGQGQAGGRIAPQAGVIGAAVGDGRGHGTGVSIEQGERSGGGAPEARETTHSVELGILADQGDHVSESFRRAMAPGQAGGADGGDARDAEVVEGHVDPGHQPFSVVCCPATDAPTCVVGFAPKGGCGQAFRRSDDRLDACRGMAPGSPRSWALRSQGAAQDRC